MGYTCPVCADPQANAEHLANHLAFTAMLGDDEHETWLEDHAPDWDQADADSLAATVAELAEETEYPQVFENTVDRRSTSSRTESGDTTDHDHEHAHERSGALFDDDTAAVERGRERAQDLSGLDDADEEILEEAREMTRQMRDSEGEQGETSDSASGEERPASEESSESASGESPADSETE